MAWFCLNLMQYWMPVVVLWPIASMKSQAYPSRLRACVRMGCKPHVAYMKSYIEQNLQADKQKISGSIHIIRINKHYSHIIHDVPHPCGWMSHASRLFAAHPDYADVKLLSSRMRNQAYGSQFAQLPAKKATRHRSRRLSWSATVIQSARCPGAPHYCT